MGVFYSASRLPPSVIKEAYYHNHSKVFTWGEYYIEILGEKTQLFTAYYQDKRTIFVYSSYKT